LNREKKGCRVQTTRAAEKGAAKGTKVSVIYRDLAIKKGKERISSLLASRSAREGKKKSPRALTGGKGRGKPAAARFHVWKRILCFLIRRKRKMKKAPSSSSHEGKGQVR